MNRTFSPVASDVVFCGITRLPLPPPTAIFLDRNNRLLAVLHLAGFTDVRLQPQDEADCSNMAAALRRVDRPTKRAERFYGEIQATPPCIRIEDARCAPRVIAFSENVLRPWSADQMSAGAYTHIDRRDNGLGASYPSGSTGFHT